MRSDDAVTALRVLRPLPEWTGGVDRTDGSRTAHWRAHREAGKPAVMDVEPAETWQPPWWLLVFGPMCWLLLSALVLEERGRLVAVVAFVLLAPVGMPIPAVLRWVRKHRRLDGAYLGPLVFAGMAVLTDVPLWVCGAAGLGAAFLGLMLGAMRGFAHH
ncbi:hypothetical protein [Kribbella monticola]|uniref:hypothetical protein n=1 Tax=Kribbella monticola TaxID=2185285 RepID=UPI00130056B0|nr:hypothetical protein [Kribbella monticola]